MALKWDGACVWQVDEVVCNFIHKEKAYNVFAVPEGFSSKINNKLDLMVDENINIHTSY